MIKDLDLVSLHAETEVGHTRESDDVRRMFEDV